jgi:hypothetical protein
VTFNAKLRQDENIRWTFIKIDILFFGVYDEARFLDGSLGVDVALEPVKSFVVFSPQQGFTIVFKGEKKKVEKDCRRKFLSGLGVSTV